MGSIERNTGYCRLLAGDLCSVWFQREPVIVDYRRHGRIFFLRGLPFVPKGEEVHEETKKMDNKLLYITSSPREDRLTNAPKS